MSNEDVAESIGGLMIYDPDLMDILQDAIRVYQLVQSTTLYLVKKEWGDIVYLTKNQPADEEIEPSGNTSWEYQLKEILDDTEM